jgi:catechol 2,3-dioxygenase-like lactoylglutathione lyase family enzyme
MAISEVHHVGITVSDVERSTEFYQQTLGFRKTLDMPLGGPSLERLLGLKPGVKARSVILQQGPSQIGEIELIQFDPPAAASTGRKRPGDPGLFMLSFEVKDEVLEDVCQRLSDQGVEFYCEPQRLELKGYGPIRAVMFEDPDGVMIELMELPSAEDIKNYREADG